MKRAKYSIRTEDTRTIVRLLGRKRGASASSGWTSAPPWEEIKHLFEGQPASAPKQRRKKKR